MPSILSDKTKFKRILIVEIKKDPNANGSQFIS